MFGTMLSFNIPFCIISHPFGEISLKKMIGLCVCMQFSNSSFPASIVNYVILLMISNACIKQTIMQIDGDDDDANADDDEQMLT